MAPGAGGGVARVCKTLLVLGALLPIPAPGEGLSAQSIRITSRLGHEEGRSEDVFGTVADVLPLPGGMAVLDSRMQELVLLDSLGRRVRTVGRAGRGPGEFFVPAALEAFPEGPAVLDRGNARVTVYRARDDGSLAVDREIPLRFQAWDFCRSGERLFLASDGWETPIVEVDGTGTVLRRFGTAPEPPHLPPRTSPNLRQSLSYKARQGRLACADEGLVWVSTMLGVVKVFGAAGDERLSFVLPGFAPVSPQLTRQGTVRYGPPEDRDYLDNVSSVVSVPGAVLVQFTRTDFKKQERSIFTYRVDLSTGVAHALPAGLPRIHAQQGGRLYLSVEEPFPQVLLGVWQPSSGDLPRECGE